MDELSWTTARKALDHRATVRALDEAVGYQLGEALADELATNLSRAGYALVEIGTGPDFTTRQTD